MARGVDLTTLRSVTPQMAGTAVYRARKQLQVKPHQGPIETVRTATHRGRDIVIKTTYDIRIAGHRVSGHIELGNDGRVHYHGLPAYGWNSAVDMCKELIDSFPDDFPAKGKRPRKPTKTPPSTGSGGHAGHGGGH
jgi:hypothetical protein